MKRWVNSAWERYMFMRETRMWRGDERPGAATGMKLYKIHAYVCAVLYVGFLVWAAGFGGASPIPDTYSIF